MNYKKMWVILEKRIKSIDKNRYSRQDIIRVMEGIECEERKKQRKSKQYKEKIKV